MLPHYDHERAIHATKISSEHCKELVQELVVVHGALVHWYSGIWCTGTVAPFQTLVHACTPGRGGHFTIWGLTALLSPYKYLFWLTLTNTERSRLVYLGAETSQFFSILHSFYTVWSRKPALPLKPMLLKIPTPGTKITTPGTRRRPLVLHVHHSKHQSPAPLLHQIIIHFAPARAPAPQKCSNVCTQNLRLH